MNITVRDGSGTIVGTGNTESLEESDSVDLDDLTADDLTDAPSDSTSDTTSDTVPPLGLTAELASMMDGVWCTVKFEVPVVDAEFYEIEAGSRGGLSYSKAELEEREWVVELTLGS